MSDTLTYKENRFAQEYIANSGNVTRAAIAAGYSKPSAHVIGHHALKKPKVRKRIQEIALKYEITPERVLRRLDNLSVAAQSDGQHGAAIKAEELLGKHLNMWIDRSLNVNVDLTTEHLAALQQLVGMRTADIVQEGADVTNNVTQTHELPNDIKG